MADERHISLSRNAIPNLDEALAWVVQRYDQEFTDAQMVKLVIEQIFALDDSPEGGRYRWTAAVSGMREEGTDG